MMEAEVRVWMRRLAELSRNEAARNQAALPDPALIWWQARLREKQDAQARAARPVAIAQWVSLVVAVVSVIVLCTIYSAGIQGMLEPAGLVVWIGGAGCCVLAVVALRTLFAE